MNTNFVIQPVGFGELRIGLLWGNGPASYSAAGDVLNNPAANEYINFPMDCTTQSRNYHLSAVPAAVGNGQVRAGAPSASQSGWTWLWSFSGTYAGFSYVASVQAVVAGSGYTDGTYNLVGTATNVVVAPVIRVTVNAGEISGSTLITPGIYQGTATFSLAPLGGGEDGGVPFTAATIAAGGAVPPATNLSAEVVQFGAILSEL